MKVLFYTSSQPGYNNLYNMGLLLKTFPDYDFYFLILEKPVVKSSPLKRIKDIYIRLRFNDGRFDLSSDIKTIGQILGKKTNPLILEKYPTFKVKAVNDESSENYIKQIKPDVIIQSGAGIIKNNIFTLARIGTINVHHGIAPEIRGIYSTFWALYYGFHDKIGVTCHFIDAGLDTGAVIVQKHYNYQKNDSFIAIQTKLGEMGGEALVEAIKIIQSDFTFETETVNSYYFSNVNSFEYHKLKKANFSPIGQKDSLKFKLMKKTTIKCPIS